MDETGVTLVSSIRRCPCPCIINNSPDSFTLASLLASSRLALPRFALPHLASFRLASRICSSSRGEQRSRDFVRRLVKLSNAVTIHETKDNNFLSFYIISISFWKIYTSLQIPLLFILRSYAESVTTTYPNRSSPCFRKSRALQRAKFTKLRTPENGRKIGENKTAARGDANERPRSRVFSRMISRTGVCTWHSGIITDRMYQTRNQEWIIAEPRLLPALNRAQQCRRITSSDPAVDDVC